MKQLTIILIACLIATGAASGARTTPFHRGVNISDWLMIEDSVRWIKFRDFTKQDFANIKKLGCDVVRLPINLPGISSGEPSYTINPVLLGMIDSVASWCEELNLHLVLDNHPRENFFDQPASIENALVKIWRQMALHFASRSSLILYEILNEPHDIADSAWGGMQGRVIDAIRQLDPLHTIVVGGLYWDRCEAINLLPRYADTNLIYTFHYYRPMVFTHQGANFMTPPLDSLINIPFPYDSMLMPPLDSSLVGTWIETGYENYPLEGRADYIKPQLAAVHKFSIERNVPVYCGEFGVMNISPEPDRARWLNTIATSLDEYGIGWTTWNYRGYGFGLFNKNSTRYFDNDLNNTIVNALGLVTQAQVPFAITPDTQAIVLYDDYSGPKITPLFKSQKVSLLSTRGTGGQGYCIEWVNGLKNDRVVFDFIPDKDISHLKNSLYTIKMKVRTTARNTFNIVLANTKESASKLPWRTSYTVNDTVIEADGQWHNLHIDLGDFKETGAWDNGWIAPRGEFDWTRVDKVELSLTTCDLNDSLWFDDVCIAPHDTLSPGNSTQNTPPPGFDCQALSRRTRQYYTRNAGNTIMSGSVLNLSIGDTLALEQSFIDRATWSWTGPGNFTWQKNKAFTTRLTSKDFGTYTVTAKLYNTCMITDTFTLAPAIATQEIYLSKGANLVSLTVQPLDSSTRSIMMPTLADEVKSDQQFWNRLQPDAFNSLLYMNGGRCYIITSSLPDTISLQGIPVKWHLPASRVQSWMLVGCHYPLTLTKLFELTGSTEARNRTKTWFSGMNLDPAEQLEPGKAIFIIQK